MTTIYDVILFQYAQASQAIADLKAKAFQSTEHEKYAYVSPDGKTFRNKRPSQEMMAAGWTYGKVKFQRLTSHMSPKHELWKDYRNAKRRATILLAAILILKANNGVVPEKSEISSLIAAGIFRSQARTSSAQKSLAYSAYRLLRKLDNRLSNQPERFSAVAAWQQERQGREVRCA